MSEFFLPFTSGAVQFSWMGVVDIIIVAVCVFALIRMTRGTRAFQVLKGLGIIVVAAVVFALFNFQTVSWILSWIVSAIVIVMVILFQQEIRRALEKLGSLKVFGGNIAAAASNAKVADEIVKAVTNMSLHKTGALIVFERKTGLLDIRETGISIDAEVTSELVENIFFPNTPMHDGAMVIKNGRIAAAGCFLPLSSNRDIDSKLGTRHRAALGLSEVSDCYVVVVSEETGIISYTHDRVIVRDLDPAKLRVLLDDVLVVEKGRKEETAAAADDKTGAGEGKQ